MRWWVGALLALIFAAGLEKRIAAYWEAADQLRIAADTGKYVSMADNLRYGIGLYDPASVDEFNANPYAYRSHATPRPQNLVAFYQNDLGLSLLFAFAGHLLGHSASPLILLVWLQIAVDVLNIVLMFWLGRRMLGDGFGLVAALIYAGFGPICSIAATFPYYYYWAACLALWNLVFVLALSDLPRAPAWGVPYGIFVGLAAMVRPSFLPLGFLMAVYLLWRWPSRRVAALAAAILVGQALVTGPVLWRSSVRFGQLTPPRMIWHTIYTGIGAHPNPYGIPYDDSAGFRFAAARGVGPGDPDWVVKYEHLMHDEVSRINRETPWLLPRNTLLNMSDGFTFYDPALHVTLAMGPLHLKADVPEPRSQRYVMLLSALAYCLLFMRPRSWLPLLQGVFFVAGVSVFIPPVPTYNSAYIPTFVLLLALLGYGAGYALCSLPHIEDRPPSKREVWVAFVVGILLCWQPPDLYFMWNRLPYMLACPVLGRFLHYVVRHWKDADAARLAVRVFCGVSVVALLLAPRVWLLPAGPLLLGLLAVYVVTEHRMARALPTVRPKPL